MPQKRLPRSLRKYIRKEKARIRREILDLKEQERLIKQLYERIQPVQAYRIVSQKPTETKTTKSKELSKNKNNLKNKS